MPLHDWADLTGWEGVHTLWLTALLRWIKPRLPAGYRAFLGSPPTLAIGAPERPGVAVRQWTEAQPAAPVATDPAPVFDGAVPDPDVEVAVANLDPGMALQIERQGRLIAAVELISPRNKDRPAAREAYLARYLGYLLEGVHLLLADVHRHPLNFSFPDRIAQELQLRGPSCPPPVAVAFRVGEPAATGGRLLAVWRRPLEVGTSLPVMTLPLTVKVGVSVDLETTYMQAAADAYLA